MSALLWKVLCLNGLVTAAFVVAAAFAPFGAVAGILGVAISTLSVVAVVIGLFEGLARLIAGPVSRKVFYPPTVPWAVLGGIATGAVVLGAIEVSVHLANANRLVGDGLIGALRVGTGAATLFSTALYFRQRRRTH